MSETATAEDLKPLEKAAILLLSVGEANAASILRYGLLENLVGVEIPIAERRDAIAWIEVKAGSRRRAAIRLLREKGHWPHDRLIPVIMRDSRGFWENLVENVVRDYLPHLTRS